MTDKWQSVLDNQGAVRDEQGVRRFDAPDSSQTNTLFALDHLACLIVEGRDARKFLQGQVTSDMNKLSLENSVTGGHCNTKGRLLFSFRSTLLDSGPTGDKIALVMHRALVSSAQQALAKFIVFSKATLAQDSSYRLIGLAGSAASELLAQHFTLPAAEKDAASHNDTDTLVRIEDDRFLCIVKEEIALELWQRWSENCQLMGYEGWNLADIRAGLGQVLPGSVDMFIPQMINMQLTGGVSFTKGCYIGQEVVARMQYLGKLKRHMRRLSLKDAALPLPGAPIYTEGSSQSVGNVVLAAPVGQQCELLAVVTDEAFAQDSLYLDQDGQLKLQPLDLPYTIG